MLQKIIEYPLDKIGIYASLACAIHCAILPIVLLFGLSIQSEWLHHPFIEMLFLLVSIPVAAWSLISSYKNTHQNVFPPLLAVLGFILFIIGHYCMINGFSSLLLVAAGVSIAYAHFWNYRLSH